MSRTMYDTASNPIGLIPDGAVVIGGYINGAYIWQLSWWQHFPSAIWNPIWVFINNSSHWSAGAAEGTAAANYVSGTLGLPAGSTITLDVEAGDASSASSHGYPAAWAASVRAAGYSPTGYTSQSTV